MLVWVDKNNDLVVFKVMLSSLVIYPACIVNLTLQALNI